MAQQARFPTPYVVFGVEKPTSGQGAQPNNTAPVPIDEELHEQSPMGSTVGYADGHYIAVGTDEAVYHVKLHFIDPESSTLIASGKLKRDKGRFGKGTLMITDGTGKGKPFKGGKMQVRVENPKRYRAVEP